MLFLLQSFTAKRTARAAVCVAVSMVKEKLITEREALLRIDPHQMQYFLHPMIDPTYGEHNGSKSIHLSVYLFNILLSPVQCNRVLHYICILYMYVSSL